MDTKILVQVLYYISIKLNKNIDKLTALKLIYFADRYHLRKYARMITDDTYYAMHYGPVASNVKDILAFSLTDEEEKYMSGFIKQVNKNTYKAINNTIELNMLSDSDKEALDFACKNFGHHSSKDLVDITHEYPEWLRFKKTFEGNHTKREKIVMSDFFEDALNSTDPFSEISKEVTELSKEFYFGEFDGIAK